MDKIIRRPESLPDTIEKLKLYIFVGQKALIAYKAKLAILNTPEASKAQRDQTLKDTQELASALLWAEAHLGDVLPKPKPKPKPDGSSRGTFGGRDLSLPPGITKKQSFFAHELSRNRPIIEEVIQKAAQKEKIPERYDVLKEIQKRKISDIQKKVIIPPGQYRTLVIDPPWPVEKILREERPYQTKRLDYPTMTIEAISGLNLPFAVDCHIYLWTTQKFLPFSFQVFESWGVKYIQTLVWHKNVGFTPMNLFMNNVEFCLFGRKGNLPLSKPGLKLCFEAKVREHSRKPEIFYDIVRDVSPEPRIDIFSREKRSGFEQWGNENDKF